ncbi:hypothetical protein [Thiobacillus sp.]|uniref:hypothetical protein n=1 Tax=Thiobacillus sp. TaxID=924 RepID=UPI0017E9371D|nr:hypothetical protein [Thiobacillus sp.]MBC2732067.1 hypothetical protein [Thiobacillus sp.]MBC2740805.1 hypothetical protein [Thiobacillus sp.]MBC2759435.1 hypothetical protein [Thiobacillus sp.]
MPHTYLYAFYAPLIVAFASSVPVYIKYHRANDGTQRSLPLFIVGGILSVFAGLVLTVLSLQVLTLNCHDSACGGIGALAVGSLLFIVVSPISMALYLFFWAKKRNTPTR